MTLEEYAIKRIQELEEENLRLKDEHELDQATYASLSNVVQRMKEFVKTHFEVVPSTVEGYFITGDTYNTDVALNFAAMFGLTVKPREEKE